MIGGVIHKRLWGFCTCLAHVMWKGCVFFLRLPTQRGCSYQNQEMPQKDSACACSMFSPCSGLELQYSFSPSRVPWVMGSLWGQCKWRLPGWLSDKETACHCRGHGFSPWVGKTPWRRKWQPTLILIAEKFHRHRSLVGIVHGVAKRWMRLSDQTTAMRVKCFSFHLVLAHRECLVNSGHYFSLKPSPHSTSLFTAHVWDPFS